MSDAAVIAGSPEQVAELLDRLDRLEAENLEHGAEVARLREENAALRMRIAKRGAAAEQILQHHVGGVEPAAKTVRQTHFCKDRQKRPVGFERRRRGVDAVAPPRLKP